ncbi:hypothetical protein ACFOZ1_01140 [Gracilibacillus marinus]|uniref:Zinc ribbon domain-containing protein n=1 Tax=Gracilibacillus marinus TaxID=630535 RepID=A0ABV8VT89_9BACI
MAKMLIGTGITLVIVSILTGILHGDFWEFILFSVSGVSFAMILFGLSYLIRLKEEMLDVITIHHHYYRELHMTKRTCSNCSHEYDAIHNTCPQCGSKAKASV